MTSPEARLLIESAVPNQEKSEWVDLGSGSGTFTYALAGLLMKGSTIHAVDKLQQHFNSNQPNVTIDFIKADFEKQDLPFTNISGIIMANALHYVEDQLELMLRIKPWLGKRGKLILIEYDTEDRNPWVPYPITFEKATQLFEAAGFTSVAKIGEMNSRIRQETIFSCMASF